MIVDEEMILECIPGLNERQLEELVNLLGKKDEWHVCPNCADICVVESWYTPAKISCTPEYSYPAEQGARCSECKMELF